MPRIARKNMETSFFHVIVQGINKEDIFEKAKFKNEYLKLLFEYLPKYKLKILAYCIMKNHVHLLIYTQKVEELSEFMKHVNLKYAKYYNLIKDRVGYVFRDRFQSEQITNERYLLNCLVYIHRNPVKAGIVKECKYYFFSSYNNYIHQNGIATQENIKLLFGNSTNFLDSFIRIHQKEYYFMDINLNTEEILNYLISQFQIKYKRNESDIKKEHNTLIMFIKFIQNEYIPHKITLKDIGNKFELTAGQVKYIFQKIKKENK